jgi:hypothetical protein
VDGRSVKWQITEWLDPKQTQKSKEHHRLKEAIEDALEELERECPRFSCYLFLTNPPVRFKGPDKSSFRSALLELSRDVESMQSAPLPRLRYTWPREGECVALEADLAAWPVLTRYLRRVQFESSTGSSKQRIAVIPQGSSFSEDDAIAELMRGIDRKMHGYQWPQGEDVRLLIFYDQGWRHNSPIYVPLRINAEIAANRLRGQVVPFKHIYLIFGRSGEAYEIYPEFARCA